MDFVPQSICILRASGVLRPGVGQTPSPPGFARNFIALQIGIRGAIRHKLPQCVAVAKELSRRGRIIEIAVEAIVDANAHETVLSGRQHLIRRIDDLHFARGMDPMPKQVF